MFADLLKFLHNQRDFILIVKVIVTFPATSVFEMKFVNLAIMYL